MWYQSLTMLDVRRRCRWRRLTLRSWWSGTPPPGHWMRWFLSGTQMCWNTHTKQTNCWMICWTGWSVVFSFYRLLNAIISVGYTKVPKHTHTQTNSSVICWTGCTIASWSGWLTLFLLKTMYCWCNFLWRLVHRQDWFKASKQILS